MDDLPDDYNKIYSWERFYPDASEIDELPPKMPEPLGPPVRINCFVDADRLGFLEFPDRPNLSGISGISYTH